MRASSVVAIFAFVAGCGPVSQPVVEITKFTCPIDGESTGSRTITTKVLWDRWSEPPPQTKAGSALCESHAAEPVSLSTFTSGLCPPCDESRDLGVKKTKVKRGEVPSGAEALNKELTAYRFDTTVADAKYCSSSSCKCQARHGWDDRTCTAVAMKKVFVGMTAEQARASWGSPEDVNRTTRSSGVHEQWVYGSGSYLYFDNGVLTAIQN